MVRAFYQTEDLRWFIDYPEYLEAGGDIEDLEMVAGADTMLSTLSGGADRIVLQFDSQPMSWAKVTLLKQEQDEHGATYRSVGEVRLDSVWLCNVTREFFKGEFPEKIYVKIIRE